MSLKNERKLIYVVAIVCLAVGVFCYASPTAAPPESPVRLMFKSVGGNVLFDHQTHDDSYGLACLDCHHTQEAGSTEDVPARFPFGIANIHQICGLAKII